MFNLLLTSQPRRRFLSYGYGCTRHLQINMSAMFLSDMNIRLAMSYGPIYKPAYFIAIFVRYKTVIVLCNLGCNNVTLMHYENRRILDSLKLDMEFDTTSNSLCITHCVETAFNGTDCTAVFSGDICKIYLHTNCDRIHFHHQVEYGSSIDVVTCDYRTG